MPTPALTNIAKENGIPVEDVERYWKDAIEQHSDKEKKKESELSDSDWAYIMGIVKNRAKNASISEMTKEERQAFLIFLNENRDEIAKYENDLSYEFGQLVEGITLLEEDGKRTLKTSKEKVQAKRLKEVIKGLKQELKEVETNIKSEEKNISKSKKILSMMAKEGKQTIEVQDTTYNLDDVVSVHNTSQDQLYGDNAEPIDLESAKNKIRGAKEKQKDDKQTESFMSKDYETLKLTEQFKDYFKSVNLNESTELVEECIMVIEKDKRMSKVSEGTQGVHNYYHMKNKINRGLMLETKEYLIMELSMLVEANKDQMAKMSYEELKTYRDEVEGKLDKILAKDTEKDGELTPEESSQLKRYDKEVKNADKLLKKKEKENAEKDSTEEPVTPPPEPSSSEEETPKDDGETPPTPEKGSDGDRDSLPLLKRKLELEDDIAKQEDKFAELPSVKNTLKKKLPELLKGAMSGLSKVATGILLGIGLKALIG